MEFKIRPFDVGPIMGDTSSVSVRLWGRANPIKIENELQRCFGAARVLIEGQQTGGIQLFKMNPNPHFSPIPGNGVVGCAGPDFMGFGRHRLSGGLP